MFLGKIKKKEKKGVYYLNYVLWPPLGPTTASPSGSSSSTSPIISLNLTFLADVNTLWVKENIANRIKVAKYEYSHKMELLCLI